MRRNLWKKIKESLLAVLPVTAITILVSFTLIRIDTSTLILFVSGAFLLIIGMGLFTLGADMAMMPMGEGIGAKLSESKKVWLIIIVCFVMGVLITIAEPDLQVLAKQVYAVPRYVMIISVAAGVGIFLLFFLLKTFLHIKLSHMLIALYGIVFILAIFVPKSFLAVAFDAGGVTTGPVSVPFIMALGIGLAAVRGERTSNEDSFGMIALCSIGPILAVMILGIFYKPDSVFKLSELPSVENGIAMLYLKSFPHFLKEVAIALSPVVVAFVFFQIFALKLPKRTLIRLTIGIIYTFIGLSIFLLAVNIGFLPAGREIGIQLASKSYKWLLLPLGMIIGFVVVLAEPAIHILTNQVEEFTGGAISKKLMMLSLTIGISIAIGISMIRVLTGISIWYFVLPGYLIALALTFFVPSVFTSIAFDSGGVASGPMTVTFILPFAMGASSALGGNILTDAFGIVTMVAMTPLLTVQMFGLAYSIKLKRKSQPKILTPKQRKQQNKIIDLSVNKKENKAKKIS